MRQILHVAHVTLWSLGWALVFLWICLYWFVPASWWVSAVDITVSDGVAGGPSPEVSLSVNYEKDVFVHWTRILLKQADDEWLPACDLSGAQQAYVGDQIVKTTLSGLFEGRTCAHSLVPGDYYIEADLEWTDAVTRGVSVDSNIFTITPATTRRRNEIPLTSENSVRRYHIRPRAPRFPWPFNLLLERR